MGVPAGIPLTLAVADSVGSAVATGAAVAGDAGDAAPSGEAGGAARGGVDRSQAGLATWI